MAAKQYHSEPIRMAVQTAVVPANVVPPPPAAVPAGEVAPQAVEHRCGHVEVVPVWLDGAAADAQKRRVRERADCGRCSAGRR